MKKRFTRVMVMAAVVVMMMAFMAIPAFATSAGNVSGSDMVANLATIRQCIKVDR